MKPLESLLRVFVELHPEDAARAFEALDTSEASRLLQNLPIQVAGAILQRLSPHTAGPILANLDAQRTSQLLIEMPHRAAVIMLNQLEPSRRADVLGSIPEGAARPLRALSEYAPDTAGGIMEPRVASLASDLTAQQAISAIRRTPREVLYYLYVTKRSGELIGVLNMRDLLLASSREPIARLVRRQVVSIPATMDRQDVVNLMRERGFLALPVVDFEKRLIGVVKHDEALEAGQLEAFEDLQKIVGAGAEERALSPISTVVKNRLPWLHVNLVTAFMAAAVVGLFEDMISRIAALAVLLPVVAGQGGNTGAQSLAVVMRGLALREVIPGTKRLVVRKEALAGLLNGLAVATVTALAVFGWRQIVGDATGRSSALALVIGLSMVVNMVAAAVSGASIPLLLKAMGRDPAQSAAIFLTTVTDIVGFASFLGFAALFASWLV